MKDLFTDKEVCHLYDYLTLMGDGEWTEHVQSAYKKLEKLDNEMHGE